MADVLSQIPGLAGYLAMQNQRQQTAMGDLQATSGIMNVLRQQEAEQRAAAMAPYQQQLIQAQVQQAQALAAERAKREQFYSPRNMQQFMIPGQEGFAAPPDELGGGPAKPATAPRLDLDRVVEAQAASGLIGPDVLLNRQNQIEQRAADREARRQDLLLKLTDARTTAEDKMAVQLQLKQMEQAGRMDAIRLEGLMRQLGGGRGGGGGRAPVGYRFSSDGETLEPIPGGPKDANSKPLPTQALKLQQAELDAIGTAASISSDLAALDKQIEEGKLNLGLFSNMVNKGRNYVGADTKESRNLASFQATLEKLRNDSLRLNKGVQTEGDAVRAWNELITNINSPGVVRQRLTEIQELNNRAVDLRRMNVDMIRQNYGAAPLDVSGYQNQPPAVGSRDAPASKPASTSAPGSSADQFEAGKIYVNPKGQRAKYLGNGKWGAP